MTPSNPSPPTANDRARTIVAGHYEVDLDDQLGAGGMALVYRGRDLRTRRIVALKTLRLEYRNEPESRARFRREARTMAFLQHPNVARVYDLSEDSDGPWAVMEYVPGNSLKEEIAEHGPFDLDATAHILDQIASALTHLHKRGLVHLDVKPQNLLITPDRTIKLIDFGIAQRAGESQEMIGGVAFGTAAYLAPEQATGEPVDPSTDVYALGCVVYELITGSPPFAAAGEHEVKNDLIRAHIERDPTPPTKFKPDLKLPRWVDDVVLWALAKKPQDRYGDVDAFARLFREGLEGQVVARATLAAQTVKSPVIETRSYPPALTGQALGRRAAEAAYTAGGQRLRNATGLQRNLLRMALILAVANVALALLLLAIRGTVPGLIAGDPSFYDGGTAQVVIDSFRFRAEPNLSGETLTVLPEGTRVNITGDSVEADGRVWWPASIDQGGGEIDGYIAQDGMIPTSRNGTAIITDLVNWIKDV